MSAGGPESVDPILALLAGKARAQAVSTAARLGIPDALREGPRSLGALARELALDAASLDGFLRFLVGLGLLRTERDEDFALTDTGRRLCSDALGPLAAFAGAPEQWDPWSRLADALAGGPSAFERTFGAGLYEYLARDPAAAARYDAAIDVFTHEEALALSRAHDFTRVGSVLDVGGGKGTLLAEVLDAHPHLRGTLFDLPHVVAAAAPLLAARFGARVSVASGDFRRELPRGFDRVLVKYVLHNWRDEDALAILGAARAALAPDGRILVVEAVLAPDGRADTAAHLGLEMAVLTGGRVRRKPELRRLFAAADLAVESFAPLFGAAWLAVLRAADQLGRP